MATNVPTYSRQQPQPHHQHQQYQHQQQHQQQHHHQHQHHHQQQQQHQHRQQQNQRRWHGSAAAGGGVGVGGGGGVGVGVGSIRVLNVAEKPSVARALAGVFARMPGCREGPMHRTQGGTQVFHHDNVCFPSVFSQGTGVLMNAATPVIPHDMMTSSVRGHLATQDFPQQYGWSHCQPVALFGAPIETSYRDDMIPLERMLTELAGQVQAVILWLDCDREGEAIAAEVREVLLRSNPRLAAHPTSSSASSIYRARFSTVLPVEIQRALKSLGRINESFVSAVEARSELDLRVGAAFTRFQTLRLQKRFDLTESGGGVISYGPCQFPTLGFVVERWARIETFIPEQFWFLELKLSVSNQHPHPHRQPSPPSPPSPPPPPPPTQAPPAQAQAPGGGPPPEQQQRDTTTPRGPSAQAPPPPPPPPNQPPQPQRFIHFTWKRNRLYDRTVTLALFASCLQVGEAVVVQLSGRPRNKWRPVPLATVELQKRASRFLRMGSEQVMAVAEELYQQGYISYPRTETERFRPEFQHRPLIQDFVAVHGEFGDYANKLLHQNYFQMPRNGQHDDNAHPPISPCKAVDPETIGNPDQRRLYALIVKHYLACVSRDAVGKETTLVVRMASEDFTAKGLMILERNWLEIYAPYERWSTGQGELPRLEVGSRIRPTSFLMKDGTTAPPLPISEVELISMMDRNGIGTDATIAQHIQTIQQRDYARKDANQRFTPTKLGIALVEGYNQMGYQLNKPDLRRETESECNLVAAGRKTKEAIMGPILNRMRECFRRANAEAHKLDDAMARHFPPLGASAANTTVLQPRFSQCGACDNQMALKQMQARQQSQPNDARNRRKLLYCDTCRKALTLPRGGLMPKTENDANAAPPFRCPICQYQVIQVVAGEGYEGNGYSFCPHCYSNPPVDHGGGEGVGDSFRCFQCQHPTCRLAGGTPGGEVEVFPCPFCHPSGKVVLRKNSWGFLLSCDQYAARHRCQYTIWLPKEATSITVPSSHSENREGGGGGNNHDDDDSTATICRPCSTRLGGGSTVVRLLRFVWRSGSVPPHLGRDCTTCVLCDDAFRQEMNLRLPQPNQVVPQPNNPAARRRRTTAAAAQGGRDAAGRGDHNRGRGGGRGGRGGGGGSGSGRGGGSGSGGGGGGGGVWNHPQPQGGGGTVGGRGANACYRCGQPGHYANSCPSSNHLHQ